MKIFLFTYGMLMPKNSPGLPHTAAVLDTVWGTLTKNAEGEVALILDEESQERVGGYTLDIDDSELVKLDEYEGSLYSRVQTRTFRGYNAWVYVLKQDGIADNRID